MSNIQLSRPVLVDLQADYLRKLGSRNAKLKGLQVKMFSELDSFYKRKMIVPGTYPDLGSYQFQAYRILDDLNIIYKEALRLGQIVTANYNEVNSLVVEFEKKLDKIQSLLADYRIYSLQSYNGVFYYGDSFDDVSKVDFTNSPKDSSISNVQTDIGCVTLPKEVTEKRKVKTITFNAESNGVPGNNNEYGTPLHKDFTAIFDGNLDTWFEYEKVGAFEPSLVLGFTLALDSSQIVNYITVDSVNFGSKDWPKIISIETSDNAVDYLSIKEDLPIIKWDSTSTDDLFTLGQGKQKTGHASFLFTPRKAKYVKFVFEQNSNYKILTASGLKDRWVIGFKDIGIYGVKFQEQGEISSKIFVSNSPLKKIAITTSQTPEVETSKIGALDHYFSIDSGQTWQQVSPIQFSSNNLDEIVNVSSSFAESIISDKENVKTLKYKSVLRRLTAGFESDDAGSTENSIQETLSFPGGAPFSINLKEVPIEGSVVILNPLGGEAAQYPTTPYFVGYADSDKENAPSFDLPFDDLSFLDIHVRVGNEEWTKSSILTDTIPSAGPTKLFHIDYFNKKLNFGSGQGWAKRPSPFKPIYLWFGRERLFIDYDKPSRAKLRFSSTGLKSKVKIYQESGVTNIYSELLQPGSNKIQLKNGHLYFEESPDEALSNEEIKFFYYDDDGVTPIYTTDSEPGFLQHQVPFIDGYTEFQTGNGDVANAVLLGNFSIDIKNGAIYVPADDLGTNNSAWLPSSYNVYADYTCYSRKYLPEYKWKFDQTLNDNQTIVIDADAIDFQIASVSAIETNSGVTQGSRIWYLTGFIPGNKVQVKSIVPKSIQFRDPNNELVNTWIEIPFINGTSEFENLSAKEGYYSVDYKNAKLYSALTSWRISETEYTKLNFQFTNCFAEYTIGLPLKEGEDWTIENPKDKVVKFTNEYGIKLSLLAGEDKSKKSLLVGYKYQANVSSLLKELAPYYTPLLKEYRMIAVTADGMRI